MIPVRLYDTRRRQVVPLECETPRRVRMYVCGITPYDDPHVGHLRSAVVFDAFVRFLRGVGYEVKFVRNVTDVDDKIIERAREAGVPPAELVARHLAAYDEVVERLGCLPPDETPRVTEKIPEVVSFVECLVERGAAYPANGSVYFRVASFPRYGVLSGRSLEDLAPAEDGAREEKESPHDFALWKAAKEGEPAWDSRWGKGRPGWHIECSAMARDALGDSFEIHGGGLDLVFPHHENEIAQSEGAGFPFARIWMHHGMVEMRGVKMAKSVGNVVSAKTAIEEFGPRALRWLLLAPHYRSPLAFSSDAEKETAGLARLDAFLARFDEIPPAEPPRAFLEALADDFHTPRAFAALFEAASEGNRRLDAGDVSFASRTAGGIRAALDLLGLAPEGGGLSPEESDLLERRNAARRAKDFAEADRLRAELAARGIVLEDGRDGTRWRRVR